MKITLPFFLILILSACSVKKTNSIVSKLDVERIIKTLSADDMQGREIFTPGIEKAAKFIENEFKQIGLAPLKGQSNFRQEFSMFNIKPEFIDVRVNGDRVDESKVMVISDQKSLSWSGSADAEIHFIKAGEPFMQRFRSVMSLKKPVIVFVDGEFVDAFNRMRQHFMSNRVVDELDDTQAAVFVLGINSASSFQVNFSNSIEKQPLYNVVGILPGKSKPDEYVIFSAHYDHIGIMDAVEGDSIANGADDNASGVTAVISLAKYYQSLNSNERTLIFVAFTAEEAGALGSQYFSEKLNPDDVVAMFNIEMIGKDSKFGKNAAFITGYDKSDFGKILQRNLEGTDFVFHPDPYIEQQLFYRSDNATLAALGVPAHTISTDQIDKDKFYHTVDDEFETLNVDNIVATIKAIALSSRSIVAGLDTPARIPQVKSEE